MIRSFSHKGLRLFAETGDTRKLSVENTNRVRRILVQLEAATSPEDMNLPGYRFHGLSGSRKGTYAVNASGNYRITFRWDAPDAIDVDLEDYH
ncbi:proteic killer suppression protein [Methylobacterium sp. 174MFSha1.1]|uniref:type II toxin-antitoxin system RelE/ParE family toxin n=1 Tax=Methylobacterium sp. 174MFSha1.1 TaxID=1502749 RepID=UPI0008F3DCD9|nr:type II toxin-antitoxin system RelE/ParE family toxin [Methylobacterium sp. 174MFSha1.1]SFU84788.1 proteic killer suppression protein [Methylobacterium sp. 174MFSha1.1]